MISHLSWASDQHSYQFLHGLNHPSSFTLCQYPLSSAHTLTFVRVLERIMGMATHSSTLAWKIPWTEEPGRAAVHGVAKSWTRLSDFTFTFHFHALEEAMATHSSVLAWRIPGTAEPGGLPSLGSHRVGHDWIDLAAAAAAPGIQHSASVFL